MKKIFAMALISVLAMPSAYAEYVERNRNLKGSRTAKAVGSATVETVTTAYGNTVSYTKEGLNILGRGGQETVAELIDTNACAHQVAHPGELVACGFDMGGGILAIVWKTATYSGGNASYYVGAVAHDWGVVWSEAFAACGAEMGAIAGTPCRIVSIVFNSAGEVVRVVAVSIGDTAGYTARNGIVTFHALSQIPAAFFRLDPQGVLNATFGVFHGALCTAGDLIAFIPRIFLGMFGEDIPSVCPNN